MVRHKLKFERNYEKGTRDNSDVVYDVLNKYDDEIGDICYSDEWKTWIFNSGIACFLDVTCLQQVIDFLEELGDSKVKLQ